MYIESRLRGTFLGMAIGDALGAAVEFKAPGTFPPVTGFRAGGPHGLDPGEWTDDTSMALALADSIVKCGWDLSDQLNRYIAWRREGQYSVIGRCFDIGMTVSSALSRFDREGDPWSCASRDDYSSGNGSIMRLAPIPMRFLDLYPDHLDVLMQYADQSSVPTHASDQCRSACRYMTLIVCGLIKGVPRDEVLSPTWGPLQAIRDLEPLHPAIDEIAEGSFRVRQPPEIRGSGYVVHSLEASLWAFHKADTFREAVLDAVNLGDDADTTGAVCGQIAGAYWGTRGMPEQWLQGIARRDLLDPAIDALLDVRASEPTPAAPPSRPTKTRLPVNPTEPTGQSATPDTAAQDEQGDGAKPQNQPGLFD